MKYLFSFILFFFFGLSLSYAQKEICDNGLDDDGNGLIDLNDTACICKGIKDTLFIPSSLIPNPSFEEHLCCPNGLAQLSCSKNWIQASVATSDYYHLCGYKNDVFRGSPPQPLPADSGYVGFLDLKNHPANNNATYKEYIGACLNKPMVPGKEYTLTFWLGFGTAGTFWGPRNSTTIAIFGTSDCKNLPFGVAVNGQLCPTNYPGWFQMTSVTASGRNKWVKLKVKLRPTVTTQAIVLGPSCTRADGNYYYWMDDLILEESAKFDSLHLDIIGNNCSDSIIIKSSESLIKRIKYQWYKDGIAINNADSTHYTILKGETGRYLLRAADGADCELSNSFDYKLDQQKTQLDAAICEGSFYELGNQKLDQTGQYELLLKTYNGCDSLVSVNLTVHPKSNTKIDTSFCEGMSLEIDNNKYDTTGIFDINLLGWQNCDSIVQLNLTVHQAKSTMIDTQICSGEKILFDGKTIDLSGNYKANSFTSHGCDSSIDLNLSVRPVFNISLSGSICDGESFQLGNNSYNKEGIYQLKYKTQFGCDSSVELNLIVKPNIKTRIDRTICDGDFVDIGGTKFNSPGQHLVTFQAANQCDSVVELNLKINQATQSKLDTTICKNQSIQINGVSYSASGDYKQQFKNYLSCDSIVNIHIENSVPPNIQSTVSDNLCNGESKASINTVVQGNFGAYTYLWNTGQTSASIQNLKAGTYTLTVTDRLMCQETIQLVIVDPPALFASVNTIDANCLHEDHGDILLDIAGGQPPYFISLNGSPWNTTNKSFPPGNYIIHVSDSNHCTVQLNAQIKEAEIGTISFDVDTIKTFLGDSIQLSLNTKIPVAITKVKWSGGRFSCDTCLQTSIFADQNYQALKVELVDANGCLYETSIVIKTKQSYYVPNVFSPNGDQLNDYFTILTDESIDRIDLFQIYDRWGELIHESKNIRPNEEAGAWKGEYRGQKLNPGVYVYLFLFHDKIGKAFKLSGDVTLTR